MRDAESLIGAIERKKEEKQPLLKALCTDTLVARSILFCGSGRTGVSVNGYICRTAGTFYPTVCINSSSAGLSVANNAESRNLETHIMTNVLLRERVRQLLLLHFSFVQHHRLCLT